MAFISQNFALAGTMHGMPVIEEQGTATDDESRIYANETGRLELIPMPRAEGIIAKALDGTVVVPINLDAGILGRYRNCIQLGNTQVAQLAPRQPVGAYVGKSIVTYRRTWVQLSA